MKKSEGLEAKGTTTLSVVWPAEYFCSRFSSQRSSASRWTMSLLFRLGSILHSLRLVDFICWVPN